MNSFPPYGWTPSAVPARSLKSSVRSDFGLTSRLSITQTVQIQFVETEVVADLVQHGLAHLIHYLPATPADAEDVLAVDDDAVGQATGVLDAPLRQGNADIEPEQVTPTPQPDTPCSVAVGHRLDVDGYAVQISVEFGG